MKILDIGCDGKKYESEPRLPTDVDIIHDLENAPLVTKNLNFILRST